MGILDMIKESVSSESGIPVSEIQDSDDLVRDLGLDSLAMFEFRSAIEARIGVKIPDGDMVYIRTIGGAAEYINSLVSQHSVLTH